MDDTTIWPQWLFLFGTAILYVALGVVGFWLTGRDRPRRTGPHPNGAGHTRSGGRER